VDDGLRKEGIRTNFPRRKPWDHGGGGTGADRNDETGYEHQKRQENPTVPPERKEVRTVLERSISKGDIRRKQYLRHAAVFLFQERHEEAEGTG